MEGLLDLSIHRLDGLGHQKLVVIAAGGAFAVKYEASRPCILASCHLGLGQVEVLALLVVVLRPRLRAPSASTLATTALLPAGFVEAVLAGNFLSPFLGRGRSLLGGERGPAVR